MTTETLNADPAELAKFSELAHRWWDPDSEFAPLHDINPLRLQWIDGLAGLEGQARGGHRLRRRHPGRQHGPQGRQRAGHRPGQQGAARGAAACPGAGTPNVEYREVSAEALAEEQPGSSTW
jgi:2-polyprenyl-6-hydroxyphenyl methylase/3-demethylubiquinone-9 3-methyltransferase